MTESEKPKPPESPPTARELDLNDEHHESTALPTQTQAGHPSQSEDVAPPKPPRPTKPNPVNQAENTLKEAFPSIDIAVVKAVLRASGGNVEPAFNALLEMSDPDAQTDEVAPPPQPPRKPTVPAATEQSQLAADEQYARQLAEHYNTSATYGAPRGGSRGRSNPPISGPERVNPRQYLKSEDERERSFIDDDLPVIRDNIKKGFLDTQARVNSWVTNFKKKIDGEDDEDFHGPPPPAASGYNAASTRPSPFGRRSGEYPRHSADHDRYDADPQVLGDDFTNLHLRDHEAPPRRSSRPLANPDLFKSTPARPSSDNGRRVSFQDGPPEEIGVQQRPTSPPDLTKRPAAGTSGKPSKWQPLASVDPNPVGDHDPFSLGDSDDEEIKKKDVKVDDNDQSKPAAAEPVPDHVGSRMAENSEPGDRTGGVGTRDQEAEKLAEKAAV
ncbi:MAG: hypothetical protein LQ339_004402 [Xanthoria mediterranea]|nr:MAG: hypothetical protein LQ339_004402 [Xanthoria mediterranea]